MWTSRAHRPTRKSSRQSPELGGVSLALKIAREATSDVPVVRQIFGVAVNIVELAERAERNQDRMRMLAEKVATLAQLVNKVASGRMVDSDSQLFDLLRRLTHVFQKVEAFMSQETNAKPNALKKLYRSLFVLPRQMEELANEVETEIYGFTIAALADMRLYLEEACQHDGQFRRLREYEVQKLGVILERKTDYGTVIVAKARVDGVSDLMVVKYLKETTRTSPTSNAWTGSGENLLATISTLEMAHPNVAQFYGRCVQNGRTRFVVMRTGVHRAYQYLSAGWDNHIGRYQEFYRVQIFVLAALAHLEGIGVGWLPTSSESILVDDHGRPSIGAFDDLVSLEKCSQIRDARIVVRTFDDLGVRLNSMHLHYKELEPRPGSGAKDNGDTFKVWMERITSHVPMLHQVWTRLGAEELTVDVSKKEDPLETDLNKMSPAVMSQALNHWNSLSSRQASPDQRQQPGKRVLLDSHHDSKRKHNEDGDEDLLEVEVGSLLVFNMRSWQYYIRRGLVVSLYYRTETAAIHEFYVIEFPEAVTADLFAILEITDDSVEVSTSRAYHCYRLFDGARKVPRSVPQGEDLVHGTLLH
ncbi:hypothetical protein EXIGLDRAFT_200306 [Exidia glandulosa HHB12029]|uniref:Protein kinase domain-containing protein n=1 Tax=Exidia glandulosa HHB12029 TaxID=1314781 RepID=A0A165EST2_EXIGL|nr:hypothetical protein EXIGLDRAFT_200306 [Exidia glandulosa HHB12029]